MLLFITKESPYQSPLNEFLHFSGDGEWAPVKLQHRILILADNHYAVGFDMERDAGIEPAMSAWKAVVLPLKLIPHTFLASNYKSSGHCPSIVVLSRLSPQP